MTERTTHGLRAAVVLASAGRAALLGEVVADLADQDHPFVGVISVPDEASAPAEVPTSWTVVTGTRGLAAQRNAGLNALSDIDVVFFFDDDAVVRPDYIRHGLEFLAAHPDVLGLTGRVLLDGAAASGDEVSRAAALAAVEASMHERATGRSEPSRELYGCNFAVRVSAIPELRFDERLPLYSWLEDHDMARRLLKRGRLARVEDCVIVHRGASSGGRTAHVRLGYSQLMNPVYLWRSGSFPAWLAIWEVFRPCAKNLVESVRGSTASWRRERLRGNAIAVSDVLRGRITPERITSM